MQVPEHNLTGRFWEPINNWADWAEKVNWRHNDLPPFDSYWYRSHNPETHFKPGFSYADIAKGRATSTDAPPAPIVPEVKPKIPEYPTLTEASRIHSVDGELQVKQPEPIAPPKKQRTPKRKNQTAKLLKKRLHDADDFDILDAAIQQRRREAPVYSTSLYERSEDLMPPCFQVLNIFVVIYGRTLPEHKQINKVLGQLCLPSNDKNKATIERAVLSRFFEKTTNAELWSTLETVCNLRGRKCEALRTSITTGDFHMMGMTPET